MRTIKELTYYYIFRIIVKFDKYLERFVKESNHLGSTGINYTICTKGNKFHQSCKCGSTTGRCL
jgi:hypothetical protein